MKVVAVVLGERSEHVHDRVPRDVGPPGHNLIAGQADREDGWSFSPNDAIGYEDASYGYDGYYVDMNEYQYYFREGFERGYEDGYYSRSQYGRYSNGSANILGTILQTILNLTVMD